MIGTIKAKTDRGFGFITPDGAKRGDKDIFFHARGLTDGVSFEGLSIGDRVEFETQADPAGRGDQAIKVRRI